MADQYMDRVLVQLPKLDLGALVEVCKHFTIATPTGKGGKRAIVVATFMAFITADDVLESVDQGEDLLRMIDGEISKQLKTKTQLDKTEEKLERDSGGTTSNGNKTEEKANDIKDAVSGAEETAVKDQRLSILNNLKLREFKVNGVVGGSSGCIDYRDLFFQMTQGKTQGYSIKEIKAKVIKPMKPGTSLRRHFEGAMHLTDDSFLHMLRSH